MLISNKRLHPPCRVGFVANLTICYSQECSYVRTYVPLMHTHSVIMYQLRPIVYLRKYVAAFECIPCTKAMIITQAFNQDSMHYAGSYLCV